MSDILDKLMEAGDPERRALHTLIATCEEMILLAHQGEWERVAELEERRCRELTDYFSQPVKDSEAEFVTRVIEKVSLLNDQLVDMAIVARNEVMSDRQALRRGSEATHAYTSNYR